jgi:hypothetical protein
MPSIYNPKLIPWSVLVLLLMAIFNDPSGVGKQIWGRGSL